MDRGGAGQMPEVRFAPAFFSGQVQGMLQADEKFDGVIYSIVFFNLSNSAVLFSI